MTRGRGFEYMTRVLAAADQLVGQGVRRHEPIARAALIEHVAADFEHLATRRGRDPNGAAQ
jgi:hypothetical protein